MGDLISKSAFLDEIKKHCGSQRYLIPESIWEMVESFPDPNNYGEYLKLPCAVGDCLYVIRFGDVEVHKVASIEIEESGIYFKSERHRPFCEFENFGKTVFFNKEDAIAALNNMKETRNGN